MRVNNNNAPGPAPPHCNGAHITPRGARSRRVQYMHVKRRCTCLFDWKSLTSKRRVSVHMLSIEKETNVGCVQTVLTFVLLFWFVHSNDSSVLR